MTRSASSSGPGSGLGAGVLRAGVLEVGGAATVRACGDTAVLLELPDLDAVRLIADALAASPVPGAGDVVPAARTVLIRFDPRCTDRDAVLRHVQAAARRDPHGRPTAAQPGAAAPAQQPMPQVTRPVVLPVVYDGPDLADVAAALGIGVEDVVARHLAVDWTVAFTGFAPGFGYLVGGDLPVPRRAEPRTRVPAGSVGLAGEFTGVYPTASPGGWQLIGRTGVQVWDAERDPPALLAPGTRVRFQRAG
ncbi:MAG: 5-oxoprolinase subunit B family protein [Angustibacter sp.]